MKILLVHNYYRFPGGEDEVFKNEAALLRENGHDVSLFTVSNVDFKGIENAIRVGVNLTYSQRSRNEISKAIQECGPDIVHVHNFFPLLTPSIYDACRQQGVPVVQTLHNFRPICAGSYLSRNNVPCEKCVGGSHIWGVIHRCYRRSSLATLAVARMNRFHRARGTWRERVDAFITPSKFMRSRFIVGDFPADKIFAKPNFVTDWVSSQEIANTDLEKDRSGALYAGRLSAEKGIDVLLKAWDGVGLELAIAGQGLLYEDLSKLCRPNIKVLGHLSLEDLHQKMLRAQFLIVPSLWYEGLPMVVLNAFACGLPVIASRLGSLAELVEDGVTGLHFTPGDAGDLKEKVLWANRNPERLVAFGRNARASYELKYTPERNYEKLMEIYQFAINRSGVHQAAL